MTNQDRSASSSPVRLLIIGCGNRGNVYASATTLFPDLGTVYAAADPKGARLDALAKRYSIPEERLFRTHVEMFDALKQKRLEGDAAVVAVQDQLHNEVVAGVSSFGLHILCEKPMATSIQECVSIARSSLDSSRLFGIGHVLRYTPSNMQIKAILDSGVIGPLVSVTHTEPVGWFHFAHSYVRGNWAREKESSFSLLTKSCHDLDILHFFAGDHDNAVEPDGTSPSVSFRELKSGRKPSSHKIVNPIEKIAAFGGLSHFRRDRKPAQAGNATRCLDCAYEPNCPYSAQRLYLDPLLASFSKLDSSRASVAPYSPFINPTPRQPATSVPDIEDLPLRTGWPVEIICEPPVTIRKVRQALQSGPYGICAYESPNDVCDNYALSLRWKSGLTGTFNLVSTSAYETGLDRRTRISGARGELETDSKTVKWTDFATNSVRVFEPYGTDGVIPAERIPAAANLPLLPPSSSNNSTLAKQFAGGHGGGDPALLHAFLQAIKNNDPSLLKSSAAEALESHIYVFAAEESRKSGKIVDVEEYRDKIGGRLVVSGRL